MNLREEDKIKCDGCGRMCCVAHKCAVCEKLLCRFCIRKIQFALELNPSKYYLGNLHFNLFWLCSHCEEKIGVGYFNNEDELKEAREKIIDTGKNLIPTLKKMKMLSMMSNYNFGWEYEAVPKIRKLNDTNDRIMKKKKGVKDGQDNTAI